MAAMLASCGPRTKDRLQHGLFFAATHHFVVDNVDGVCNMEHIPQKVRSLMALEVKQ
jgi:hypothetical protein